MAATPIKPATGRHLAPDPRQFTTYEDAFAYPIPTVRRFETQLQTTLHETRSRIRSLVGDGYRELLGSADTIIHMHRDMQRLDDTMDLIARKCNSTSVDKPISAASTYARLQRQAKLPQRTLAAELTLSRRCMAIAARLTKLRDSPLLAAKLLLFARLLLQSASAIHDPPRIVHVLSKDHRKLTRRLLASIHDIICHPSPDRDLILHALAAYSLVTSSTPKDVLRHYLHARQTLLTPDLQHHRSADRVRQALDVVFRSLHQVHALFPKRLAEHLTRLSDAPILQDQQLRSVLDSDLDLCEMWLSDNVKNYSHWVRHDELTPAAVNDTLKSWSSDAIDSIISELSAALQLIHEPEQIATTRHDLIVAWLSCSSNLSGLDAQHYLIKTRSLFQDHFVHVIEHKANSIRSILAQHLTYNNASHRQLLDSLWDPSMHQIDVRRGAAAFRHQIEVRRMGKDDSLQQLDRQLRDWRLALDSVHKAIELMRTTKWQDAVDDFDDQDDRATALTSAALTRDDPQRLAECLKREHETAVTKAIQEIDRAVNANDTDDNSGPHAIYLLRLTREVIGHCTAVNALDLTSVPDISTVTEKLCRQLSSYIAVRATSYTQLAQGGKRNLLAHQSMCELWEGEPALPRQPSTACVKFVYQVSQAMQSHGFDIWTSDTVDEVKRRLTDMVREAAVELLTDIDKGRDEQEGTDEKATAEVVVVGQADEDAPSKEFPTQESSSETGGDPKEENVQNPTAETAEPMKIESGSQQVATQLWFDLTYLQTILETSTADTSSAGPLQSVIETARGKADRDHQGWTRVQKCVVDYHRRTYLLFGVLCLS